MRFPHQERPLKRGRAPWQRFLLTHTFWLRLLRWSKSTLSRRKARLSRYSPRQQYCFSLVGKADVDARCRATGKRAALLLGVKEANRGDGEEEVAHIVVLHRLVDRNPRYPFGSVESGDAPPAQLATPGIGWKTVGIGVPKRSSGNPLVAKRAALCMGGQRLTGG